jgi:hypothetical protein
MLSVVEGLPLLSLFLLNRRLQALKVSKQLLFTGFLYVLSVCALDLRAEDVLFDLEVEILQVEVLLHRTEALTVDTLDLGIGLSLIEPLLEVKVRTMDTQPLLLVFDPPFEQVDVVPVVFDQVVDVLHVVGKVLSIPQLALLLKHRFYFFFKLIQAVRCKVQLF